MKGVDIFSEAKDRDISVNRYNFSEIDGICVRCGERKCVGLRKGMDEIQEREVLAHEIGHFEDGTDGVLHILADKRADRKMREMLIPMCDIRAALEEYPDEDISFFCSLFGVNLEIMQERMKEI